MPTDQSTGATHRAMKESIKGLDDKIELLDEKIENNFKGLSEKFHVFCSTLDKNQVELTALISAVRDVVNKNLLVNNRRLLMRINTLERRVVELERTVIRNGQNSRKNNLELSGIPRSVDHGALKSMVSNIISKMSTETQCTSKDIEACHRMSATNPTTIVKFKSREIVDNILKNKKDLKKVKTDENTRLFVNHNLCPELKEISYNCRILKRKNLIEDTWNAHGTVSLKEKNGHVSKPNHILDLFRLFPDFDGFTFDREFCANAEEDDEWSAYDAENEDDD